MTLIDLLWLLSPIAVVLVVLLVAFLDGVTEYYRNKFLWQVVREAFFFGMQLKRAGEAGELTKTQTLGAYLYVIFIFLPIDYILQFKLASVQMDVKPKFELTTSLIANHLHCDAKDGEELNKKTRVIALRKWMDDRGVKPKEAVQYAVALGYFDIIDQKKGDLSHFKNANDYRSVHDEDKQ